MIISHKTLRGHRAPITVIDGSLNGLIATGSEDRTVRLWDSHNGRAIKCFHNCFCEDIEAVLFHPTENNFVIVASGDQIFSFDIRSQGILCSTPLDCLGNRKDVDGDFFQSINAMSINPHIGTIAISDDSCSTYLVPLDENGHFDHSKPIKSLKRIHNNIIGSISFNPNPKLHEVFTGGYDCQGCLWDLNRHRPLRTLEFQPLESFSNSNQILNPPFLQCAGYIEGGKYILCCLGDGSIRVLNSRDLSVIFQAQIHNGPITAMTKQREIGNLVFTGGIDGEIHGWNLKFANNKKNAKSGTGFPLLQLEKKITFSHHSKINVLYTMEHTPDQLLLFVGDTSATVTQYLIKN